MRNEAINTAGSAITKATYLASGGAVFMGFTAEEWGIIGVITGIILSVGTALFNVWFKMKYQRRSTDK